MSKIFIKNYKEGLRIDEELLVVNVTRGLTNAGATYLNIEFQDNTGVIDAKLWDASEKDLEVIVVGTVLRVYADVLLYRNNLQLRINETTLLGENEYNLNDFLKSSPIKREDLETEIYSYIEQIDNKKLYDLTSLIIKENSEDYFTYPTASRIYHDYVGGLASHTLGMLKIADHILAEHNYISKSLLYSGILLHDFGKISELSGPVLTEYTIEGKLLGHISLMQADLLVYAKELNIEDSEEVMLLRHMILAHHGE